MISQADTRVRRTRESGAHETPNSWWLEYLLAHASRAATGATEPRSKATRMADGPSSPARRGPLLRALASNVAWTLAGASLGLANSMRHRIAGYRNPRPFGPSDVDRNVEYSIEIVDRWRDRGLNPDGLRVLELGPGPDLGTGFVLIALGAESYTAVDRFPLATAVDAGFYQALADRLNVGVEATLSRIRYCVGSRSASLPPNEGFDAFVSNAALEHLADVRSTFAWMASVAAPGALHIHLVDAQTHMRWVRPRDPWNILRYPTGFYRVALSFPGSPNRMLASDYIAEASSAGIRLSVLDGTQIDGEQLRRVRPFLARAFRARDNDDLRWLTFTLVGEQDSSPAPQENVYVGSAQHAVGASDQR